jgi:hypothetical protein
MTHQYPRVRFYIPLAIAGKQFATLLDINRAAGRQRVAKAKHKRRRFNNSPAVSCDQLKSVCRTAAG